jgi:hypothetical protein
MKARQDGRTWTAIVTNWQSAIVLSASLLPAFFSSPGCSSDGTATTRPSMDEQANNAIRDPMHYSPFDGKPDKDSSGDHLEHRSLQQDLNDVIHP